jgi:pimeloyl-ACP methyl ester carboxylesterase
VSESGHEGSTELVTAGGVDLFVRRFGAPALPMLVVVHGGPTWDHSYLLPAVAGLADLAHVVLFDLRGCGRSSRTPPMGEAVLRNWARPILILQGNREMSFPVSLARKLHAAVPASTLAEIPDAAHMAHFDNPQAWLAAVRGFLRTTRPPRCAGSSPRDARPA